ncbi:MAG: hypothetical protein KF850_27995 [Labilithrix sp.]|nr:hypothetical protein [Labilithrix sp.]
MRSAVIAAMLNALGLFAALVVVVSRLRGRGRALRDAPPPASFAGWSAAGLSDGPTSRRWLLGDDGVDDATRSGLAAAWQETARSAHRTVASSTRRALDLVTLSAPPELVASAHEDALDRIRRAKLCFALARGIDGRGPLPGASTTLHRPLPASRPAALARLASEVVVESALADGVAACVNAKLARRAIDPSVRAALTEIAAAEARHANHAWEIVAWCLAEGGAPVALALEATGLRLEPSSRDVPHGALDGGWERWGIAGAALERREHRRMAQAVERRLAGLAGKDPTRLLAA